MREHQAFTFAFGAMAQTMSGLFTIVVGTYGMFNLYPASMTSATIGLAVFFLGAFLISCAIKSWIDYAKEPVITTTTE